jgi:hypothetical protein
MQELGKLMDKWINDQKFRQEVRKNPEQAVRATGANLTDEEWQTLRCVDWNCSDEELKTRISKGA